MDAKIISGEDYYRETGLERFGFSPEEKREICGFYEHFQHCRAENIQTYIEPLQKDGFDEIMSFVKGYLPEICLLWEDGNSNYAGVYYTGMMRGKVMFFSHDELWDAPIFRNIASFVQSVKTGATESLMNEYLSNLPYNGDYPAKLLSEQEKEEHLALAKVYLEQLRGEDDDIDFQFALKAFYLMPAENLDLLFPLLKSGNMYIEQDIPEVFAFHNYRRALPLLKEAAENGSIHLSRSAKRAVAKMGGPAGRT